MVKAKKAIGARREAAILKFARLMNAREFGAALLVAAGWAVLDPSAKWRALWETDADNARRCLSREGGAR